MKGVLLGAGFFAAYQAEAWGRIAEVELSAVVDPHREKAEAFAAQWGIPRVYTEVDAALDQERPEFVDIATRPDSHRDLTELAAGRGVHVVCQKPMAPEWADCLAMVEACERAGVRLLIHENWRWQPWYREIRRLLEAGELGRPFHLGFQMRTGDGFGPEPYAVQPYFREMERFLLFETAVHFLDTFRYLLGEVREVFCRTDRINSAIRGEDYALIQVEFASGAHGLIDANRISGPNPPPVAFGTLLLEGERGQVRLVSDGSLYRSRHGEAERPHEYAWRDRGYKGDSVFALQRHFVECLRSGVPSETEGREYLKTVALVCACYESAAAGVPVCVDGPDSR